MQGESQRDAQLLAGLRGLEAELAGLDRPWWHPERWKNRALGCSVLAIGMATVWSCFLTPHLADDPWFGLHAEVFCPLVCRGCHGPYEHYRTETRRPGGSVGETMADDDYLCVGPNGDLHELPLALLIWLLSTIPLAAIPAVPVVAVWSVYQFRVEAERRADLLRRIEQQKQAMARRW